MNDEDQITDVLTKVEYLGQPANPADVEKLDQLTNNRLPRLYLSLLLRADGLETGISINPYTAALDSAQQVIDWLSDEFVPNGFVRIGGRDGEMILFDLRKEPPWVACLPMMDCSDLESLCLIAKSFPEFLDLLREEDTDPLEFDANLEELRKCAVMLDADMWTDEQIPNKIREFELDKYAPEYTPIAGAKSTFIGIKKSDGTIWEVPLLGTTYLTANRMADSLERLHKLTAQLRNEWFADEWRYYERK